MILSFALVLVKVSDWITSCVKMKNGLYLFHSKKKERTSLIENFADSS